MTYTLAELEDMIAAYLKDHAANPSRGITNTFYPYIGT